MSSPAIRFAGFTDDWEERKIQDLADRHDNLRIPITASNRVSGNTPYYGANGIQDYVEGFTHDGEFILVAEDGANDLQDYPVNYVNFKVWVNNHAHVLQAKQFQADNKFLMNALKHTDIEPYLVGGGRAKLNAGTMMEISFPIPTVAEQSRIGKFFFALDDRITLHQRAHDKTVNIKKALLEKMFPKAGEDKPEIRFAGFTDAWEQRKLGEITSEFSGYATLEAGLPLFTSARSGLMYQCEYRGNQTTDSKKTLFSVVPLNACTYRHMSDDDVFHMNINTLEKGLVSREYPVFLSTEGNDLNFIIQHLNSSSPFRAFCKEQKKGGTRTRLYYEALCEFTMQVPTPTEQKRISRCLLTLDDLLTLHQRELTKLQNIKKALLEKMFV